MEQEIQMILHDATEIALARPTLQVEDAIWLAADGLALHGDPERAALARSYEIEEMRYRVPA